MADQHQNLGPPKWASRFLRWFLREELIEEVEGDITENYLDNITSSPRRAKLDYCLQVIGYLRPFAIRGFSLSTYYTVAMFRNYFRLTLRSLLRNWKYASINVLGLSISLAVVFLMLLWVASEWNTDKFHVNGDQLYLAKRIIPLSKNTLDVSQNVAYPLLIAAVDELPEVERFAAIPTTFQDHLQVEDKIIRARGAYANADYFNVFSFPILAGDISQLDQQVNAIAITEHLAEGFFGSEWRSKALGSTIHIHDNGDFLVEAIIENYPENASIKNDFLYSLQAYINTNEWILEWDINVMQGVLELKDDSDPARVEAKLQALLQAKQEGDLKEGVMLQKFEDAYLYSEFDDQAQVSGGRIEYVRLFLVAALLLLIISCINFVNLATARASKRALEVGVRKTVGATRRILTGQFMTEAFTISAISVLLALLLSRLLLPALETLTEKELTVELFNQDLWLAVLLVLVLTGLLSGAYPAFVLSSFQPIHVLKGRVTASLRSMSFRRVLVVVQFTLALFLMIAALVVRSQIYFVQNTHLGIDKDHLIAIHQDEKITKKYEALRNTLEAHDEIIGVTAAGPNPHQMGASTGGVSWPQKRPDQGNVQIFILWSAHNFPEVFNVPLAAGRYYRESEFPDSNHIVLNEKAIEVMNLGPDPIGKSITWWGKSRQVIGVLRDFHNQSLYSEIQPAGFLLDPPNAGNIFVKVDGTKTKEALAVVEKSFLEVIPEVPLHYEFMDDRYHQRYKSETLMGKLADYFAFISLFISCLGLLGLVTFVAEQKTRELGIRKILGAPVFSLVSLLSRDFIILVAIAFVVTIPLSYFLLSTWMAKFAYQAEINWFLIFAVAGLGALSLTLLTVCIKSISAAVTSPINAIRTD